MNSNRHLFPLYVAGDSALPSLWQTADDRVMGGVSVAHLHVDSQNFGACLSGRVSLENRGGFVQMKWPLATNAGDTAAMMHGVYLEVRGNHEDYNLHLRTTQLWLPWQSFRHRFFADDQWRMVFLPFRDFEPHSTMQSLNPQEIRTIAVVALGRAFDADVCVRKMGFYLAADLD